MYLDFMGLLTRWRLVHVFSGWGIWEMCVIAKSAHLQQVKRLKWGIKICIWHVTLLKIHPVQWSLFKVTMVITTSLNLNYSVIGTSSVRRVAQLKRKFPHLVFKDVVSFYTWFSQDDTRCTELDTLYSVLIKKVF